MTQPDYSLESLAETVRRWGDKGVLNKNTASSMRIAAERIIGSLEPEDREDIRHIDFDVAINRFHNLYPDVSPSSLRVYKSRVDKAVEMFIRYREDPINWRPDIKGRKSGKPKADKSNEKIPSTTGSNTRGDVERDHKSPASTITIPFPLRPDVTISIAGIPRDLNRKECERLGAFIDTLASDYAARDK